MTIKKSRSGGRGRKVSMLILQSREIGAAEFKARCLEIMDEVERTGVEVTITKHRKPVARVVPVRDDVGGFCGSLAGWVLDDSDVMRPLDIELNADESNLT